jgi:hypothetical protein
VPLSEAAAKFFSVVKISALLIIGIPVLLVGLMLIPSCSTMQYVQLIGYEDGSSRLYLYEYQQKSRRWGLPIPERPPNVVVWSSYQLGFIDLDGTGAAQRIGKPLVFGRGEGDGIARPGRVVLQGAVPRLTSYQDFEKPLLQAVTPACEFPDLVSDGQDSRIVYLYCAGGREVHRFLPPYSTATRITLPDGSAIASFFPGEAFFSTIDESQVFIRRNRFDLFRVDIASAQPVAAIDGLPGPNEAFATEMRKDVALRVRKHGDEPLLGVTSSLRLYELWRGSGTLDVGIVEQGQEPRRVTFSDPVIDDRGRSGIYSAPSGYVVWTFGGLHNDDFVVSLNVRTGQFKKLKMPTRL